MRGENGERKTDALGDLATEAHRFDTEMALAKKFEFGAFGKDGIDFAVDTEGAWGEVSFLDDTRPTKNGGLFQVVGVGYGREGFDSLD